jgi:hypothetical protein
MVRTFLKVYMELGSYFLFLQEQIKDIIITRRMSLTVKSPSTRGVNISTGEGHSFPMYCGSCSRPEFRLLLDEAIAVQLLPS